ncbi:MAG: peptidylprolyl isomerase [Rhodocyclaceae bacterium]|nr:peptidylprolyl isomerase [Rhodocyclaceae bacterium]
MAIALSASLAALPVLAKEPAKAEAKKEAKAEGTPETVANVNGKAISRRLADAFVAAQAAQGRPDSEELRAQVRDELIQREIISQKAVALGLDKNPAVQAQMELARQSVLVNAYVADYVRSHQPTEDQMKAEYEKVKAQRGDKEFKARHVLVETEDQAKAIIDKLKKGEKFDELAKQSKDPGSKDKGGELGWSEPANYVKPFADALKSLAKGKFTEAPVKTDFGWHVILLEDSRELKMPSMDEVKPQIGQMLVQQQIVKHMQDLRSQAKIK